MADKKEVVTDKVLRRDPDGKDNTTKKRPESDQKLGGDHSPLTHNPFKDLLTKLGK